MEKGGVPSLKLTANAPENGWLEYDRFLLGPGLFSGDMLVSGRVAFRIFRLLFLIFTPWKIKMEPENHLCEKENHLPNLHFCVPS